MEEDKEQGSDDMANRVKTESRNDDTGTAVPLSLMVNTGVTQNVVTQMMDISEPLGTLRTLLSQRLDCYLDEHEIHLQNTAVLDPTKSLLEQGVKAEGIVQFSVEVISSPGVKPVVNILDIVKPIIETVEVPVSQTHVPATEVKSDKKLMIKQDEQVTQLIVCNNYREEQEKQNIPFDPIEWTAEQTGHWLNWAATEFGLSPPRTVLDYFQITGDQLCLLSKEDFSNNMPKNMGDLFWTHLQVLIKTKEPSNMTLSTSVGSECPLVINTSQPELTGKARTSKPPRTPKLNPTSEDRILPGNRTGNNGQIQLWQFLLELLTDWHHLQFIRWVGEEGEFKLINAEIVAQKWGQRKNKLSMNYEKLSRALRYYYDGDMIAKVHGKRFVYKFVCNLKELIGYSASELKKLVTEAHEKNGMRAAEIPTDFIVTGFTPV